MYATVVLAGTRLHLFCSGWSDSPFDGWFLS